MTTFSKLISPFTKFWQFLLFNSAITLIALPIFNPYWQSSLAQFGLSFVWGFTIFITQWFGHVFISDKLTEKFPWEKHTWRRATLALITIPAYAVIAYLVVQFTMIWIVCGQLPENPIDYAIKSSKYSVSISFAISLIFTSIGFFTSWKQTLLDAEKFKTQMLAYKYEALQNQINPHFLFNSFNVLSDLVYDDPKKAASFINQLSQLFRYVLDNREKELVQVSLELQFLQSYIFLLKTRFENKLNIIIDVDAQPNELMVPMGLQLLIENCVKHNEVSSANPLTISIKKIDDCIEVRNNFNPKNVGADSKKTGLANLKQQYSFFTDKELVIENNAEYYTVKVPIIKTFDK